MSWKPDPEYSVFGAVREPSGSSLPGIAPTNAYACKDGYVLIAGNGDSIFKRLMEAIGRKDLGTAPDLADNAGRVKRVAEIDAAIASWTATRHVADVLPVMDAARVPAGRIYTAKDIHEDPHYRARDMILRQATRDGYELDVPGIVPKMSETPAQCARPRLIWVKILKRVTGNRRNGGSIGALKAKGIIGAEESS